MAFTNSTTHYGLPQWIGTDNPTYLVDQNNAYATIDTQLYTASTDASSAVATANSAASSATTAAENAATALSTANTADGKADSAITQSELAQTAAGAAQVAAAAAQEAAAGNSIANLAPAYDSTLTYAVGDLVTAEGKLYKCIVAVTTPMDFDINYWDDVTTSEVYLRQSELQSRLQKIGMNDRSAFRFDNDYDYMILESAADNGKIRTILFDVQNNVLKLRKSSDNGVNFEDSMLYPTMVVGQQLGIQIDTFANVVASDSVYIPIQSPAFFDSTASNYSITVNAAKLSHKAGTSGDIDITTSTATIITMRKDCALIQLASTDIASESYTINDIVRAYVDVTITRNS